jgi:hypothetical protein
VPFRQSGRADEALAHWTEAGLALAEQCLALAEQCLALAGAFSWTKENGIVDLGTLGGTYANANDVNGRGLVAGTAALAGDATNHAFAWTKERGWSTLTRSRSAGATPRR